MSIGDPLGRLVASRRSGTPATDLESANARLLAAERFADVLLESVGHGLYGVDLEGRCIFANAACVELLGFDHEDELLGEYMHALVHYRRPDGTPYPAEECGIYRAFRAGVMVARNDEVFVRRDGTILPVEYRAHPILEDGKAVGSVLSFADITPRLQSEAELDHGRALQRLAGATARLGGWSIDFATGEVTWSQELHDILEFPPGEAPDLWAGLDLYLPEHHRRVRAALGACRDEGTPFDVEAEIRTYRGETLWARLIGEPRRAEDGSFSQVVGALQDVTPQHRAAERARGLAERLTATLENMSDGFFTVDREWRFTYVNHRIAQNVGRDRDELLGADFWEEFGDLEGTEVGIAYRRAMEEGVTAVVDDFYYPPLATWFDVRIHPGDDGLAVHVRDVTERHLADAALRDREAKLAQQAALLDEARDAILVRGLDHRITYWNKSAERLYGWGAEEALGRSVRDVLYADPAEFDAASVTLLEQGEWAGELTHVARDGSELAIEARWTLVRDQDGRPQSVLAINTDVTERRAVEQQLLRAQRMESLGTLAGGIAHDLNNVLAPILLATQTLQLDAQDERTRDVLDIIEQSTTRGAEMVRHVLSFARGVDGERVELDLKELLGEVVAIARETFPKDIRIEQPVQDSAWPVTGDPTQLHQVATNLCVNARDAMPDGGTLRLSLRNTTVDDQFAVRERHAVPGPYVVLTVEDDGTGMDEETVERLFEPFFTTKAAGQGTGLGLPTSRGIVHSHGGFFQVSSKPGVGSTFQVFLPASVAAEEAAPSLRGPEPLPAGNGELILVVDDDRASREITVQTLEVFDYRAVAAVDGVDALRVFGRHREEVAAVLTDMMMPNLDGPGTIRELFRQRPELPIIAASGLAGGHQMAEAAQLGVECFLAKPYSTSALLTALADLLADASESAGDGSGERRDS